MGKTIVYWSGKNPAENFYNWNLMYDDPEPVISSYNHYGEDRKKALKRCPAFTDKTKNTFIIRSPFDFDIDIVNGQATNKSGNLGVMQQAFTKDGENALVQLHMNYYFFSEEDLEITIAAPFFNKAEHLQYGAIVPGTFNISKWFRAINLEFNIWEGVNSLKIKKNEPLAYISFNAKNKIEFKRFNMTQSLHSASLACSTGAAWEPNISLAERYSRFMRTKTNKIVIKEIKNNLLD